MQAKKKSLHNTISNEHESLRIYLLDSGKPMPDEEIERLSKPLPCDEQRRILSHRLHQDRQNALLSRLLLQEILQEACPGEVIEIKRDRHRRPFLASPTNWRGDFNLAHSVEWIACGIINAGRVGIDIEKMEPLSLETAKYFLSPEEWKSASSLVGEKQTQYLYEIWTAKEAYLKAIGTGLHDSLRSLTVVKEDDHQAAIKNSEGLFEPWYLRLYSDIPGYRLAVCASQPLPEKIGPFIM